MTKEIPEVLEQICRILRLAPSSKNALIAQMPGDAAIEEILEDGINRQLL